MGGALGVSGRPRDATTDANVKVVHTLVSLGAIQSILTYILGMPKLGKMGAVNVDR